MAERTEDPKLKEQNPKITYRQDSFAAGMYHDRSLPASQLPDASVRWARNMLLFPDRAEVRPGTELWSSLAQPTLPGRDGYVATKTGHVVTKTAGASFSSNDVDSYFVWPSGNRDLIVEYLGPTQIRVKLNTAEAAATLTEPGHVEGPKNARNFWHDGTQRLFGFFDNRVFHTNFLMTDPWTEVKYHGPISAAVRPISQWSTFDAYRNFIYLINPNGIFVIDTDSDPMEMWKANLDLPTNSVTEVAKGPGLEFGRRYTHTFSRLAGQGYRNRNQGARIQQETGNCAMDPDKADQDYAVVYGDDPSLGYRTVGPFTVPVTDRQWTHIALYCSQNIEDPETLPEKFILNTEVPIGKAFDASRDNDGIISIVPGGQGQFAPEDVGNPIVFENGTTDTIMGYISPTEVSGGVFGAPVLGQAAAFGRGRLLRAAQSGTTITRAGGAVFVPADVGRRLFWADGYSSFIVEYVDADHLIAETSSNHVSQAATMDPYERYIADLVSDSVLEGRKEMELFILSHRNWVPLPIIKAGVIVPGFLIAANAEKNEILQSAMGQNKEYLAGYYHPYYQVLPTKDNVILLREFPGRLVVYCSTSTRYALTNSVRAVQTDAGDYIPILSGLALADQAIGIKDVSAVYEMPDGRDFVLTSEPAPRFFNGQQYSENLAIDPYGRSQVMEIIRSLQAAVAIGYDEAKFGLILYGSDEPADT